MPGSARCDRWRSQPPPTAPIWFTIDQADAIGRIRGGRIELLPTPGRNFEPLGLGGRRRRKRLVHRHRAPARSCASAPPAKWRNLRSTARSCGSAGWQSALTARSGSPTLTGGGITQLKDGTFTRHEIGSADGGPYGVAVTSDGFVWATLQGDGKLVRIEPGGTPGDDRLAAARRGSDRYRGRHRRLGVVSRNSAPIASADGRTASFPISRSPSRMPVSAGWQSPLTGQSGSEWCAVRALAACATARSQPSGFRATTPALTALLSIPTAMSGMPTSADMSACFRPDMPMVRSQQLRTRTQKFGRATAR